MKWLAVSSLLLVVIIGIFLIPQASAVPVVFNQNTISITWTTQARNSSVTDVFMEPGYNGTITSWFHNTIGSTTWINKLGSGATFTAPIASYADGGQINFFALNGSKIYFVANVNPAGITTHDIITNTNAALFHQTCVAWVHSAIFTTANYIASYCLGTGSSTKSISSTTGNVTITTDGTLPTISNQKFIQATTNRDSYNSGIMAPLGATLSPNTCELTYMPTNATKLIDVIACDKALPNHSDHFWYGLKTDRVGNFVTNSTYPMIQAIHSSTYNTILTLPDQILGIAGPTTRFILHTNTGDYMFVLNGNTINYATTSSILAQLSGHAIQEYLITNQATSSNYEFPTTLLQNGILAEPLGLSTTISTFGVMSIPSGYTFTLSTAASAIRIIDPQWTNDNNFYPVISSGATALFPVILTVNNAPTDASLIFTNPNVNLSYTYEPNLIFGWISGTNTIDSQSRTWSSTTQPAYSTTSWGSNAKVFSGSNYLSYPQNLDTNFTKTSPFSVSFWYSSPAFGAANKEIMGNQEGGSFTGRGWGLWLSSGGGAISDIDFTLVNTDTTNQIRVRVPNAPILDSNYHHITMTYSGSGSATGVRIYLDGINQTLSISSNTLTGSVASTHPLTIGVLNGPFAFLTGNLADIKIYNIALSSSNVNSLFIHSTVNPVTQVFGSTGEFWTVTRLDSTRTAEFDLPPGTCGNVYVADNSVSPFIYNYEGNICATGSNVKTISYTNTLPLNFWNLPYGITHTFIPSTNGLTTFFHTTSSPVTYKVIIKNSTGAITQNQSFTLAANSTLDTRNFNTTNATKPAGLFVYVGSSLIYSAYMGSALSLASVASFFNTYLSYQGFSLLAFIPIIFAAMFTRNTVGIGVVLTILCIATLSWLSIVVIPNAYIAVMMLIGVIGLIAYRIYYG